MTRRSLLLALALTVVAACGQGPPTGARPADPPASRGSVSDVRRDGEHAGRTADAAPDFTVTTFDGARFTLSAHRGRPVVLNFWESW